MTPNILHPFFETVRYPWERSEAVALHDLLKNAITNPNRIDLIYQQSGPQLPPLALGQPPDIIWKAVLEHLASTNLLKVFCDIILNENTLKTNRILVEAVLAIQNAKSITTNEFLPQPEADSNNLRQALTAIRGYLEKVPHLVDQQRVSRDYIWPLGTQDIANSQKETQQISLQNSLTTIITEQKSALILLLGTYGSGKTSFMYMFGKELAAAALTAFPEKPIPLYLSLGFARNSNDLLDSFCKFLARYSVRITKDELQDFLFAHHNCVLLLDGFDEMADWIDYSKVTFNARTNSQPPGYVRHKNNTNRAVHFLSVFH